MNTSALFSSVRYRLPEEQFSPYQITDALNYVVKEINLALNIVTSSLTTATAGLTVTNNEAALPADFESMISVGDWNTNYTLISTDAELDAFSYQIVGSKMKIQGTTVLIYYRKSFPIYTFSTTITPTTIDLPVSFDNLLIDSVINRAMGQPVNVQSQALRLISVRDGKKRSRTPIFTL